MLADDLAAAREAEREERWQQQQRDAAWCIIAAVAEHHGLDGMDPRAGAGWQDDWYKAPEARAEACRLLYHVLEWPIRKVAERMGQSASAYGCYHLGQSSLCDDDLVTLARAEKLYGGSLLA